MCSMYVLAGCTSARCTLASVQLCGGSIYITSLYLTELKDIWYPDQSNSDFLMQQA